MSTEYKVTCLTDEQERVDATSKRWVTWADACAYARTVARSRFPMVEPHPAFQENQPFDLGRAFSAVVKIEPDSDAGPPWAQCDGHGPVSEWTTREKKPGELIIARDGGVFRYYDFAAAVKLARKDGWTVNTTTVPRSAREMAVFAVEADYKYLKAWCDDEWRYIGVLVEVYSAGQQIGADAVWGIEDCPNPADSGKYYWHDVAVDMIEGIISSYQTEQNAQAARRRVEAKERRYWEARGVVTK